MPKGVYKHYPHQGFQKGHKPFKRCKKTQFKKGIPNNVGKKNPMWQGGRYKTIQGYILIKKPNHLFRNIDNYIFEHRLVIEKHLGRYLKPSEPCHHLGKRNDNRLHMLMAFISNSAHIRFERGSKVKSEEIIFDGRRLNGTILDPTILRPSRRHYKEDYRLPMMIKKEVK